jgi:hypothetical protein
MGFQSMVVFVVVACCAVFVARGLMRRVAGTSEGCSGCGGCSQKSPKTCAQPVVVHRIRPSISTLK